MQAGDAALAAIRLAQDSCATISERKQRLLVRPDPMQPGYVVLHPRPCGGSK